MPSSRDAVIDPLPYFVDETYFSIRFLAIFRVKHASQFQGINLLHRWVVERMDHDVSVVVGY